MELKEKKTFLSFLHLFNFQRKSVLCFHLSWFHKRVTNKYQYTNSDQLVSISDAMRSEGFSDSVWIQKETGSWQIADGY